MGKFLAASNAAHVKRGSATFSHGKGEATFDVAGSPGLEPGKKASKASVIPFHHDPELIHQFDNSIMKTNWT